MTVYFLCWDSSVSWLLCSSFFLKHTLSTSLYIILKSCHHGYGKQGGMTNVGVILYLKYVLIYYLCVCLCVWMCRICLICQWRHHKVYLSWLGYIPRVYVTRQPMSLQQWEQAITVGGSHWFRSQWFNEINILLTTVKFVWLVNKLSQAKYFVHILFWNYQLFSLPKSQYMTNYDD